MNDAAFDEAYENDVDKTVVYPGSSERAKLLSAIAEKCSTPTWEYPDFETVEF